MYFFPRNNRWYSWGARIKSTYRYGITCISLASIAGIWWYAIYQPLNGYINYCHTTRNALQQQIEFQNIQMSDESRAHIRTLQEDIEAYKLDGIAPAKQSMHIIVAARNSGLKVQSYTASKEKEVDWHSDHHMHIDVVGSLDQSISFLMALHDMRQLIQCSMVHATYVDHNQFTFGLDIKTVHIL